MLTFVVMHTCWEKNSLNFLHYRISFLSPFPFPLTTRVGVLSINRLFSFISAECSHAHLLQISTICIELIPIFSEIPVLVSVADNHQVFLQL